MVENRTAPAMATLKNNDRIEWIDHLRFIAIVGVVIIHSQGASTEFRHGSENWWIFNVIDSLAHFSVPIFVMLSGTLLLRQDLPLFSFLKKRFIRILFPFLFWSLVLFVGNIILGRPLSTNSVFSSFFYDLLTNRINGVYWFIYMLIGLYLITPIFTKWIHCVKIFELEYFLLIWSLTLFLGLFPAFNSVINLTYFSGFIGYFILGYYLNTKELKQGKILPIALILIGGSITVLGSYLFEDIQWKSYLSPTIVMLSTGVFLFIKNAHLPKLFAIDKLVIKISEYSYGIYLIHAVFISILSRIGVNSLFISPYIGSFILATAVIMISVMFLEVFKRLPFTKNISGL